MDLKVLLVDDDKMMLFLHKIVVKSSKSTSEPYLFLNGQELLDFLAKNKSENHHYLIMLDLNMPGMNGWEVLNKIHNNKFYEKVIICIVTSSINSEDKQKAKNFPQVIEYVEKPLDTKTCERLIESAYQMINQNKD